MATRKNRPVLYEVAGLSRRQRERSWKRRIPPSTSEQADGAAAPSGGSILEAGLGRGSPSIRVVNRRVFVGLGWPGLTVVAVGALCVLVVTFQAGKRSARSQLSSESPPTAGKLTDDPGLESPAVLDAELAPDHRRSNGGKVIVPSRARTESGAEPGRTADPLTQEQTEKFAFKPGQHYVIIQHFRKSKMDDAVAAYRYLEAGGVSCVIVRQRHDVELIAREPFLLKQDSSAAAAAANKRCDALMKRIRELGKEYVDSGGYGFQECYKRKYGKR